MSFQRRNNTDVCKEAPKKKTRNTKSWRTDNEICSQGKKIVEPQTNKWLAEKESKKKHEQTNTMLTYKYSCREYPYMKKQIHHHT